MAKIKADLVGVVHAHTKTGTKILRAGDTVPRGVKVAKDLLEDSGSRQSDTDDAQEVDSDGDSGEGDAAGDGQ